MKGVAGLRYFPEHMSAPTDVGSEDPGQLLPPENLPDELNVQIAGCHSLVYVDNELVGDPMETGAIKAIGWTLTKGML